LQFKWLLSEIIKLHNWTQKLGHCCMLFSCPDARVHPTRFC